MSLLLKPVADFYVDDKGYKLEDWDKFNNDMDLQYKKEFFFDTADLEFIKITEKLEGKIDFKLIKGVTTNPNAFNKITNSMYQWVEIAEEIGNFLYDLRQDNKGEVHIQLPNANLKIDHAVKFANFISKLPKANDCRNENPTLSRNTN